MSEQDNIRIARQTFESLNKHDLNEGDKHFSKDVKAHGTGMQGSMNRDQSRQYTEGYIAAFPDLNFKIKDVIAQGNLVAVTWDSSGTHKGALNVPTGGSIPPTNKRVVLPGVTVYEFRDGLIVRQEVYWDQGALMMQLGLQPDFSQTTRRSGM